MRFFALFSAAPHPAADVERTLREDLRAAKALDRIERVSLPGTGQQTILLTVSPLRDAGSQPEAK